LKFEIKTDPKNIHHYIIAVHIFPATAGENAGKYHLKYKPIHFTNDDVEDMQQAAMLSVDKLFKTSDSEALATVDKTEFGRNMSMLFLAASVNQCTLHHFSSEFEIDEETFDVYVKSANYSNDIRDQLFKSIIRGR
jgi:hypothetical protein